MSETQTTVNPQVETDLDSNEILKGLEDASVLAGYVPLNKADEEDKKKKKDDESEDDEDEDEFEESMDAMKKKYPKMMKKYMSKKDSTVAKAGDDVSTISSVINGHIQEAESAISEMNGIDVKGIFNPFKEIAKAIEVVAQSHNANSASFEDRLSSVEDKLEKAVDVVNKMIPGIALLVKKHVETEKSINKADNEVSKASEPAQAKGIVGAVDETGEEPKTPEARFAKAIDELVKSHGVKNAVNDFFAKANEVFATNGDVTAGEIAKLVAGLNHYEYDKLKKIPSRYINKAEELIKAL